MRRSAAQAGVVMCELDDLLKRADFVVVACLLNDATRRLLSADRLRLMKPSAYLINVARGPIIDEPALIDALSQGRIAGAALDVFEREPPDPSNPLLDDGQRDLDRALPVLDGLFRRGCRQGRDIRNYRRHEWSLAPVRCQFRSEEPRPRAELDSYEVTIHAPIVAEVSCCACEQGACLGTRPRLSAWHEATTTKAAGILVSRHPRDTTERVNARSSCTATTADGLS